ncbi:alpha/beta-hydrolase [Xylaria digitata]|nr:alpha/beta-hydrolase [Xylaria digitata]
MSTPFSDFPGYHSRTLSFKAVEGTNLELDVVFPTDLGSSPIPVLIHYHGGFFVVGDRYSVPPFWLIQACVRRRWIFVSPDYRLMPESTAHEAVDDALDSYSWVLDKLSSVLGTAIGPVVLAGSSAGAYLALTTAALSIQCPQAVVSLYGLLNLADKRYYTKGANILGIPTIETSPVLGLFPSVSQKRAVPISGYPWPEDLMGDSRFALVMALHIDTLLPDFATGVSGLSQSLAANGLDKIQRREQRLFIDAVGYPPGLPPVFLLHGKDDAAIPFRISESAADKLRQAGAKVAIEFPDNAQHGFDALLGRIDIEEGSFPASNSAAVNSLNRVLQFLDQELPGRMG